MTTKPCTNEDDGHRWNLLRLSNKIKNKIERNLSHEIKQSKDIFHTRSKARSKEIFHTRTNHRKTPFTQNQTIERHPSHMINRKTSLTQDQKKKRKIKKTKKNKKDKQGNVDAHITSELISGTNQSFVTRSIITIGRQAREH